MDNKPTAKEEEDDDLMAMLEETQQEFDKKKGNAQAEELKKHEALNTDNSDKANSENKEKESDVSSESKLPNSENPADFFKDFEKFAKNLQGNMPGDAKVSEDEIAQASNMFKEMFKIHDDTVHSSGASGDAPGVTSGENTAQNESANPFLSGYNNMSKDAKNLNDSSKMPGFGDINKMFEDEEFKGFFNQFTQGMFGGEEGGFDPSKLEGMGDPEKMMENLMKEMTGYLDENSDNPELKSTIEEMMSGIIKKESLYPSMKMMKEELPKYLEENYDKLSAQDLERYNNQLDIIEEICGKYESENEPEQDSIVESLFKLQNYGAPPDELSKKLQETQKDAFPGMADMGALGGFPGMGGLGGGFPGM